MEGFVGIAVLVIVLVFAVMRAVRSEKATRSSQQESEPRGELVKLRSFKSEAIRNPRFDQRTAKPVEQKRILTGSAWIVDGDTIKIKNTQIRLYGIDAPELSHPYGKKAKWALHNLCKGQTVRAEISDEDEYQRTVARCYLADGRDLSAEMVKQGLAIDWPKFSGGAYRHLETSDARKRLFLADARQKGQMHIWKKFESRQAER